MALREGTAKQKVPGGKMLTVKLKFDSMVREAQILGDFFLFPEDSLPIIESALIGMGEEEDATEVARRVEAAVSANGIRLVGITPESIAQTAKMAMR